MTTEDNALVRALTEARYGHLERRFCTAERPMSMGEKDQYRWSHPDAAEVSPFFNLVMCRCPHCGLQFTCLPREA